MFIVQARDIILKCYRCHIDWHLCSTNVVFMAYFLNLFIPVGFIEICILILNKGINTMEGVVMLASTNRQDILDQVLIHNKAAIILCFCLFVQLREV